MVAKPSAEVILRTYSLDELLDLAKLKARRHGDARLEEAKKYLESLTRNTDAIVAETPRRGRRKGTQVVHYARGGKKMSLGGHLLEVLGSQPQKIDEIMSAILARGYKTKSQDPKRVLYLELKKQLEHGTIDKIDRGLYIRK